MIDSRLLDEPGTDDLERELLSIAVAEAPRPGAKERALSAALAAASAGAGTAVASSARAGARLAFLKWIGLAVLLGALGLWALARRADEPSAAPAPPVDRVATSASASATPIETTPLSSATATQTETETATPPPPPTTSTTSTSTRPAEPRPSASADEPSLNDEVAALDAARMALQSGDTSAAIAALDSYKKKFSRGALAEEALVLRVEALERRGDHAAAHALADPFLAKSPRGTYANRIRTLLGDAGGK